MSEILQNNEQEQVPEAEKIKDLSKAELEDYRQYVLERYNYAEQTLNAISKEQDRREEDVLRGWSKDW